MDQGPCRRFVEFDVTSESSSDALVGDVIKVSGHRLSTAEIESALILYPGVAEAAVVGANDELTGQAVHAFVTLKKSVILFELREKDVYD